MVYGEHATLVPACLPAMALAKIDPSTYEPLDAALMSADVDEAKACELLRDGRLPHAL